MDVVAPATDEVSETTGIPEEKMVAPLPAQPSGVG